MGLMSGPRDSSRPCYLISVSCGKFKHSVNNFIFFAWRPIPVPLDSELCIGASILRKKYVDSHCRIPFEAAFRGRQPKRNGLSRKFERKRAAFPRSHPKNIRLSEKCGKYDQFKLANGDFVGNATDDDRHLKR